MNDPPVRKMTAKEMTRPLLAHFNWVASRIIPQCAIDGGIADLLIITQAGYLTEVEIKVTSGDWKADLAKSKWRQERLRISRFFYAVPFDLRNRIPEGLPGEAGILLVNRERVEVLKPAIRSRAKKVDPLDKEHFLASVYFKFWNREFKELYEAANR